MSANPRIAFVTGGSGFVGRRLIARLVSLGWEVRALARSDVGAAAVAGAGATVVIGDLLQGDALRRGMAGAYAVFHVAGHLKLWDKRKAFEESNVAGTQAVVDACRLTSSVTKLVAIGASAVVMGEPEPILAAREDLPLQHPSWGPYIATKAEAERIVLAANDPSRLLTSVVRPPLVWGAGMPMLDAMIADVKAGRFQWPEGGGQRMSTAHVDNVCHCAILAAEKGRGGEAYFVADDQDGTLKGVISALLATKGVPAPTGKVHFRVAWFMARLMEGAWRVLPLRGDPPVTRQMLRMIGKDFTLDTTKARRELGYAPVVAFDDGVAAMKVS